MVCNESLDFQQAISHALQRIQYGSQKLSTHCLHFAQMRFGKPSSSFNVISDRALILDASLSWLAFFTKQCYSMVAITHRGSTKTTN